MPSPVQLFRARLAARGDVLEEGRAALQTLLETWVEREKELYLELDRLDNFYSSREGGAEYLTQRAKLFGQIGGTRQIADFLAAGVEPLREAERAVTAEMTDTFRAGAVE